ncbi:IBR domain protein [Venturia nashicola]|uniref:RBR-type E3 ubiquitin transferase n=1 Tax=Venturia nashicola TaxID=86259 RepID=A0A4Z1NQG5_9PEZI|nr:IBR domain protein [Venturia nashicola]
MAITKKALRKQAARERQAARKAQKQLSNASSTELNDQEQEQDARSGDGDDGVGPKDQASVLLTLDGDSATSLVNNGDNATAPPNVLSGEAAVDAVFDEANVSKVVAGPSISLEPSIVVEAVVVSDAPTAQDAPIDVEALLTVSREEHAFPDQESSPSLLRKAPEAPTIPNVSEPAASSLAPKINVPLLAVPAASKKPTRVHSPPVTVSGPSYSRRDPFTGVLADDLDGEVSRDGSTTAVSDEMYALQLQLEEIRQQTDQKGKYRSDRIPDLQLALATFHAEVNRHIEFLNDVRFANSVAQAVHVDAPIIADLLHEETIAQEDHLMAIELNGGRTQLPAETGPPKPAGGITIAPMKPASGIMMARMGPTAMPIFAPPESITRTYQSDDPPLMVAHAIGQMAALRKKRNAPDDDDDDNLHTLAQKTYMERQSDAIHKLPRRAFECNVCTDMFRKHEIIQLDCKHLYCPACLKNTFIHASSDIAFFPPHCCNNVEIDVSLVSDDMSTQEMEDYTDTRLEVNTPKRTYCCNNQCGKFIPTANVDADHANCTRCGTITCIHCKVKQHPGECAQDVALQSTLALAASEGWKRCHACMAMVELQQGCYHMTCKCGSQFCYLCGALALDVEKAAPPGSAQWFAATLQ